MAKRKTIHVNRGQIFNYWQNICIDKDGFLHQEGDYPIENSIPVVPNWDEQCCWGCGKRNPSHSKEYSIWVENESYRAIWDDGSVKTKLERAHIIADGLGGPPIEENLFLLCPTCHLNSPDTKSRRMFFKWIYNKRKSSKTKSPYYYKAVNILKSEYNISYPLFDDWNEIIKEGDTIVRQSGLIPESTYVYSLVANALKNKSGLEGRAERMFENKIRGKIEELMVINPNDRRIDLYKEILGWYRQAKQFEESQEWIDK